MDLTVVHPSNAAFGQQQMRTGKNRKRKPFRASTEVRRLARLTLGAPPPGCRHQSPKDKPPKHKKREAEEAAS